MPFRAANAIENLNTTDEPGYLSKAADLFLTPIKTAFDILDAPAGVVRDTLAGRDINTIINDIVDPENRATGRELLRNWGVNDELGVIGGFDAASIITEIATDPMIFTGSVVGKTKEGAKAARLTEALDNIKFISKKVEDGERALRLVNDAGELNHGIDLALMADKAALQKEQLIVNTLMESGTKPLAATRREQIELGQRGLSFSTPFSKEDWIVPVGVNKLLAPVMDKVGGVLDAAVDLGKNSWAGKTLKELFSTSKETKIGSIADTLTKATERNAVEQIKVERALNERMIDEAWRLEAPDLSLDEYKDLLRKGVTSKGVLKTADDYLKTEYESIEKEFLAKKIKYTQEEVEDIEAIIPYGEPSEPKLTFKEFVEQEGHNWSDVSGPGSDRELANELQQQFKVSTDSTAKIAEINRKYDGLRLRAQNKMLTDKFKIADEVGRRKGEVLKANEVINATGDLTKGLIHQFHQANENFLELALRNKVAVTDLADWKEQYFRRIMTPQARTLMAEKEAGDAGYEFAKEYLSAQAGFQKSRRLTNMTFEEASAKMREIYGITDDKFQFFVSDPNLVQAEYKYALAQSVNRARTAFSAIEQTAKVGGEVPIEQVLKRANVTAYKEAKWAAGADVDVIKTALKEAGYEGLGIPKNVFNDLYKLDTFNIGKVDEIMRNVIDPINLTYRSLLTFSPAHWGTNVAGNSFMNWIAGIKFNPEFLKDSFSGFVHSWVADNPNSWMKRFVKEGEASQEMRKLYNAYKTYTGSNINSIGELLEDLRPDGPLTVTQKMLDMKVPFTGGKKISDFTAKSYAVNAFLEEVQKFQHFASKVQDGASYLEAATSVKKYLFDYTDLTKFEKQVMKRGVLFYTFARKNLPLAVAETLVNRKAYLLERVVEGSYRNDDFVPEYVKTAGIISLGGGNFIDLKVPLYEANRFAPQGGGLARGLQRAATLLAPEFKVPLEIAAGKEFYRGRPFDEVNRVNPNWSGLPGVTEYTGKSGQREARANPLALEFINNLPTARLSQAVTDLTSQSQSIGQALASNLTGMRMQTIDPQKAKLLRDKIKLQQILDQDMTVKRYSDYFSVEQEPNEISRRRLEKLRMLNGK